MGRFRLVNFLLLILLINSLVLLLPFDDLQASTVVNLSYKVKSGDTLWLLAQRFGTTVISIKRASGYWSDYLYVGQKLIIPVAADHPRIYVVRSGDSLWKIAQRYAITVNELKSLNDLTSNYLYVGQVLLVPEIKRTQPASRTPDNLLLSPGQMDLLARLVQAEAGGEIYEGQVAVAAVVINRIKDPRFPDTLEGVIYERWAFESVMNGWFNRPATQSAYNAARDALRGWDPTGGALFFYNPALTNHPWMLSRPIIKRIGNHVFTK